MALTKGTNSYVTLAEANTYFADRLDSDAWVSANDTEKSQALITAASMIDSMSFEGYVSSDTQVQAFPRTISFFDPRRGCSVTITDEVPSQIITANYELAIHLLNNRGIQDATGTVTNLTVGTISLQTIQSSPKVPMAVLRFIRPLLVNGGSRVWWRTN